MAVLLVLVGVSVLIQQVCRGGAQSCSWMFITPNGSSGGGALWDLPSVCVVVQPLCSDWSAVCH